MKIGDLVRLTHTVTHQGIDLTDKTGIITDLSEPNPIFAYRVATIVFDSITCDGIPARMIEVLSEQK